MRVAILGLKIPHKFLAFNKVASHSKLLLSLVAFDEPKL